MQIAGSGPKSPISGPPPPQKKTRTLLTALETTTSPANRRAEYRATSATGSVPGDRMKINGVVLIESAKDLPGVRLVVAGARQVLDRGPSSPNHPGGSVAGLWPRSETNKQTNKQATKTQNQIRPPLWDSRPPTPPPSSGLLPPRPPCWGAAVLEFLSD